MRIGDRIDVRRNATWRGIIMTNGEIVKKLFWFVNMPYVAIYEVCRKDWEYENSNKYVKKLKFKFSERTWYNMSIEERGDIMMNRTELEEKRTMEYVAADRAFVAQRERELEKAFAAAVTAKSANIPF